MKNSSTQTDIHTIPQGTYEAGTVRPAKQDRKKQDKNDLTTDLQGNGYPVHEKKQEH